MDRVTIPFLNQTQCFFSASSFEDDVTISLQNGTGHSSDGLFILCQQDCFKALKRSQKVTFRLNQIEVFFDPWQIDLKCRALSRFAINPNTPTNLFNDAVNSGKTKARSSTLPLRGEEGFKDVLFD